MKKNKNFINKELNTTNDNIKNINNIINKIEYLNNTYTKVKKEMINKITDINERSEITDEKLKVVFYFIKFFSTSIIMDLLELDRT